MSEWFTHSQYIDIDPLPGMFEVTLGSDGRWSLSASFDSEEDAIRAVRRFLADGTVEDDVWQPREDV